MVVSQIDLGSPSHPWAAPIVGQNLDSVVVEGYEPSINSHRTTRTNSCRPSVSRPPSLRLRVCLRTAKTRKGGSSTAEPPPSPTKDAERHSGQAAIVAAYLRIASTRLMFRSSLLSLSRIDLAASRRP